MLSSQLQRSFTPEQIIKLLSALGSDPPQTTATNDLIFQTICHNPAHEGSHKLYYYCENNRFQCYTNCGNMDIYELVEHAMHCNFREALTFVQQTLGIIEERKVGFSAATDSEDWEILNKYAAFGSRKKKSPSPEYEELPKSLLEYWDDIYPLEWKLDNIKPETCKKYGIRFDTSSNAIVIPHYERSGKLVGIRSRFLDPEFVESGFKYMPAQLEGRDFRHTLRYNLYGLYQNEATIRKAKRAMLVEAEKSVMQCDSYYHDQNYTVAVCGSNVSEYQRDLILSLGVNTVDIAFDKEYHEAFTPESDSYADKILKIASMFAPYVRTCVVWDTAGLLGYKDSPTDQGQFVLEELLNTKYEVFTKEK